MAAGAESPEQASAPAAVTSSSPVELSSRTSCLAWLRLCGVRAPLAVRIPHDASDAAAVACIEALVAQLSTDDRLHGGLRAQPDRMPAGDNFSHYDGHSSPDEDDCAPPDGPGAIQLSCPHWLSSALAATRCIMNSGGGRDVCLRHEPGNGRIGLMLRRCPQLIAAVQLPAATVGVRTASDCARRAAPRIRLSEDGHAESGPDDACGAVAPGSISVPPHSASALCHAAPSGEDATSTWAVPVPGPNSLNGPTAQPAREALPKLDARVGLLAGNTRFWLVGVPGLSGAWAGGERGNAAGQKENGTAHWGLGQLLWRMGKIYCSELPAPPPASSHGVRFLPCHDAPAVPPAGDAADNAIPPRQYSLCDAFAEDPDAWRKVCWSSADAAALHGAACAAAAAMVRAVTSQGGAGLPPAAPAWCEPCGRDGGGGDDDAGPVIHVELELCFGRHWVAEAEEARCEWVGRLGGSTDEAIPQSDLVDVHVVGVALAPR